jgi:hypothetical protein
MTHHKEGHGFLQSFFDAQTVAAFWGIQWDKVRVKFRNEFHGIYGVRAFRSNDGRHLSPHTVRLRLFLRLAITLSSIVRACIDFPSMRITAQRSR